MQLVLQNMTSGLQEVPSKDAFCTWVQAASSHLPPGIMQPHTLNIRIVNTETMTRLNTTYRNRSGPTNVLSFPPEDIALCGALVLSEAAEQEKTVEAHWAHLTVHAFLHLCGYDHIEPKAAHMMESQEREILLALGFPNPYTD